jgi:hypothetical protein
MLKLLQGELGPMAFKVFESRSHQLGEPAVTVTTGGAMRLNKDAADVLKNTMKASYILILWDEENSKVAISTAAPSDQRAYKLNYHAKGSGAAFAAKAFLKHIGWDSKQSLVLRLSYQKGMLQTEIPRKHLKKEGAG